MAAKNIADDRVVYVAFNTIFQGQDSQIRKLPSIKRLVRKHKQQPQVTQLLKEYGEPVICEQLQKLLGGQVFESTLKAKCEFPELFEVSRAQSAERAISEAEAAAGHAKAVEEALAASDSHAIPYESDSDSGKTGEDPQAKASTGSPSKKETAHEGVTVPSLFPLEFQFVTGYKILVKTQQILELACFRFAKEALPEILEKRKWHCPESAELNLWATEFLKRMGKLGKKASGPPSPSRPLRELLPSIAQIRHHAVHRIPVTARELEQFMADGAALVELFGDDAAMRLMSRAKDEVHKAAAEMENKKNMLEAKLAKVLQDIADKRAELDRVEAEAIADMQRKDKEYQLFAGAHLQESIWLDGSTVGEQTFATQSPAANGVDNDSLLDQVGIALESDVASYEDFKMKDTLAEESMASTLGGAFIGDAYGDSVPAEVEEAQNECLESSDADDHADGDDVEAEKGELASNASEGILRSQSPELGWPHVLTILGIPSVEK